MSRNSPVRGPLVLVAHPAAVLEQWDENILTASERRRGAALAHRADREAYVAAHLLVRHCAAALTGRIPGTVELVQRCSECGSTEHGKPSIAGVPDLHVSLAHTRGAVVAGAGWQPIGVDVEGSSGLDADPAVLAYALTTAETSRVRSAPEPSVAFLRHWVRKECLVKVGAVTLDELARVELELATERAASDGRTLSRFGSLHLVDWFDRDLDAVVAAAAESPPLVDAFPPQGPGEVALRAGGLRRRGA
ncbi:4'-phosphopantetheinyl transferase superfamily protein [Geodermatophilus sp. YIM 151500]|uniref:4'-phosphopantetheinyl transferase family protein n=1 Tax=Geodermatophilus sp. YIM 151500 TaxID=2984531 RepID=UPI0021E3F92A|nr:4'-phosphopantetheinyl transferase superfamily protein [Geodermatophilus sp. YIM 151500]MCV2490675.1 4'-phosphopantetheinyl transferase superfamily protein [Geodermatophilus sp. YIM 151500]